MDTNLAYNLVDFEREKSGVTRLTLTDFRNYQFLRINAALAPIIITGENGSGKTNILEAVSFLTPGRGLRGARLADIKRITPENLNDEYQPTVIAPVSWAISAEVQNGGDIIEIGTAVERSARETEEDDYRSFERRIVKIDGNKISSQAELGKYISAIWLTPQWIGCLGAAVSRGEAFSTVWFTLLIWNTPSVRQTLNICTKNGTGCLKKAKTTTTGSARWKKTWPGSALQLPRQEENR